MRNPRCARRSRSDQVRSKTWHDISLTYWRLTSLNVAVVNPGPSSTLRSSRTKVTPVGTGTAEASAANSANVRDWAKRLQPAMAVGTKPQSSNTTIFRVVRVTALFTFPVGEDGHDARQCNSARALGATQPFATCKASAPGRITLKAGRRGPVDTALFTFATDRTHSALSGRTTPIHNAVGIPEYRMPSSFGLASARV